MNEKPHDATDTAGSVYQLENLAQLPSQVSCLSQSRRNRISKASWVLKILSRQIYYILGSKGGFAMPVTAPASRSTLQVLVLDEEVVFPLIALVPLQWPCHEYR